MNTEIGGATADSYVSVASAAEYFNGRENADKWWDMEGTNNLTATARKEGLLKQATREIDNHVRFTGSKYYIGNLGSDEYQALEFPRESNIDDNDDLYIPDEVKYATYEQALWIMDRGHVKTNPITGFEYESNLIGRDTYNYIKKWITRQVKPVGNPMWQESKW